MNKSKRLIYADDLLNEMEAGCIPIHEKGISGVLGDERCIKDYIDNAPTVEAPCEQIKRERDIAIKQVESYGVKFCEKAEVKEVKKVVHGYWLDDGTDHGVQKCRCSICEEKAISESDSYDCFTCYIKTDYCLNCGEKMKVKND